MATVPDASEEVVMERGVPVTVMERATALDWMGLLLSYTLAVKTDVPPCIGVPVMAPVEAFKTRPAGRTPGPMDQL